MELMTSKSYGIKTGFPFAEIFDLGLEQDGFQSLGQIHKPSDSTKTVQEIVIEFVAGKGFSIVVYQAKTRKKGEYKIDVFAK